MSKYRKSLQNKRAKFHSGSHSSQVKYTMRGKRRVPQTTWTPHNPNTSSHATDQENVDQLKALEERLDNLTLTPEQIAANAATATERLKEAPLDQPIVTPSEIGKGPELPDATAGLAPDMSTTTDTPFVTKPDDIQTVSTEVEAPEVKKVEAANLISAQGEAAVVDQIDPLEAQKFEAAAAENFTAAAQDLMGVPQGEAASALEKVNVQAPKTSKEASEKLALENGVNATMSEKIATDPLGAIDQVENTDLESRANIADLPEEALVSTQLDGLLAGMEEGKVPLWAKPAVDQVNAMMAKRGLNASSVGRDALFTAIIQSALPIAQSNAQAIQQRAAQRLDAAVKFKTQETDFEQQMKIVNLSNQQQAFIQERNFRQQTILSNQAAENASRQFNATSQQQTDQFMAGLQDSVNKFNAQAENAMKQFNITEENRLAALNVGNQLQADQFEASQLFEAQRFADQQMLAREQWNATNAQAIEQSNIAWRRNSNTAATAAFNAANQQNVQNAYNLTALEQTQVWQALRDDATYLRQAYESEQQRKTVLFQTAIGNESAMTGDTKKVKANRDALTEWLDKLYE